MRSEELAQEVQDQRQGEGDEEHRDEREVEADVAALDPDVAGEAPEPGEPARKDEQPDDDERDARPDQEKSGGTAHDETRESITPGGTTPCRLAPDISSIDSEEPWNEETRAGHVFAVRGAKPFEILGLLGLGRRDEKRGSNEAEAD